MSRALATGLLSCNRVGQPRAFHRADAKRVADGLVGEARVSGKLKHGIGARQRGKFKNADLVVAGFFARRIRCDKGRPR